MQTPGPAPSRTGAESPPRSLPITFSLVGVQKGATGSLNRMITSHRQVARGPKERHFFDNERRRWDEPDYSEYRTRTSRRSEVITGDATPIYIFWPRALERMRAYNPDMRLLAIFRDPVERAFSAWSMERGRGVALPDFGAAIADERFASVPNARDADEYPHELRVRTMVARGHYGRQLRNALSIFDRDQWLLLDFHRFLADPGAALDRVTGFLGIGDYRRYPPMARRNTTPGNHVGTPPSGADVARLAEIYADDLDEFTMLSGLDTSAWSTARILSGTVDPAEVAAKLARRAGLVS